MRTHLLLFFLALATAFPAKAQKVEALKTINELVEIQLVPIREYFRDLHRIRMQIPKPDHNYWFNYGTAYSGEPYFRIIIRRERRENYLREIMEFFVETMFSARLDFIREGENLKETTDEDLLRGLFPLPGQETKYILASSILGFEFFVQQHADKKTALFSYNNNSIRYGIEEHVSEDRKLYKYSALVFGTQVDLHPQIEVFKIGDEWEPRYSIFPRRDLLTAKTYAQTFDGLFGVAFQFNCFLNARLVERKWPFLKDPTCLGVNLSWGVPSGL